MNKLEVFFHSPVESAKRLNLELDYPIPPDCPPKTYKGNFNF
jgi:hypothetical protein